MLNNRPEIFCWRVKLPASTFRKSGCNQKDHGLLPAVFAVMKGLVLRSTGSWYEVVTESQRNYSCRAKGKLRLDGSKETNRLPLAIG